MAADKTIRATEEEYSLLQLIRGAKLHPDTVQDIIIAHLHEIRMTAKQTPAPDQQPKPDQDKPSPSDTRRDNYHALREAGYTVPECRKYRYLSQEKIYNLLEAKKKPEEKPTKPPREKKKSKTIEKKEILVEVD